MPELVVDRPFERPDPPLLPPPVPFVQIVDAEAGGAGALLDGGRREVDAGPLFPVLVRTGEEAPGGRVEPL